MSSSDVDAAGSILTGNGDIVSALVQLALALVASGVLVKVLTLRQDRRKIAGDASASEANAASVLSGAALQMVSAAQKAAADADVRSEAADHRAQVKQDENERLWGALNNARWDVAYLEAREAALENALRAVGGVIPPAPERVGPYPQGPPPAPRTEGPAQPPAHRPPDDPRVH